MLAGGRYDGLMESLGGPHTPAVGWAAGIERLGMLIENFEIARTAVAVVAESAGLEPAAHAAVSALRRAGIVAEAITTGGYRKRYDRAVKLNPVQIYSLQMRDGALSHSQRGADASKEDMDAVRAIVDPIVTRLA